ASVAFVASDFPLWCCHRLEPKTLVAYIASVAGNKTQKKGMGMAKTQGYLEKARAALAATPGRHTHASRHEAPVAEWAQSVSRPGADGDKSDESDPRRVVSSHPPTCACGHTAGIWLCNRGTCWARWICPQCQNQVTMPTVHVCDPTLPITARCTGQ